MKRVLLVFFVCILFWSNAQNFEMTFKSPQAYNPAFVGLNDFGSLNLGGNLYNNTLITTNTYVGYNTYVKKISGGIGVYNFNRRFDKYSNQNRLGVNYAYQTNIKDNWALSIGGGGEYIRNVYSFPDYPCSQTPCIPDEQVFNYMNLRLGGVLYSKQMFIGVSAVQPLNFSDFFVEYNINAGYHFDLPKYDALNFNVSIEYLSDYGFGRFSINSVWQYKQFYLGTKWINFDYVGAVQLGADFNRFRLYYSVTFGQSMFDNAQSTLNKIIYFNEIALQIKLPKFVNRNSKAFTHLMY